MRSIFKEKFSFSRSFKPLENTFPIPALIKELKVLHGHGSRKTGKLVAVWGDTLIFYKKAVYNKVVLSCPKKLKNFSTGVLKLEKMFLVFMGIKFKFSAYNVMYVMLTTF